MSNSPVTALPCQPPLGGGLGVTGKLRKPPSMRAVSSHKRRQREFGSLFVAIGQTACHNSNKEYREEMGRTASTASCGTHRRSMIRRNRRKRPAEVCTKFPQKNYTFHQKAARIVNSSGERLEKNRNPVYNESKVSRIMRQNVPSCGIL